MRKIMKASTYVGLHTALDKLIRPPWLTLFCLDKLSPLARNFHAPFFNHFSVDYEAITMHLLAIYTFTLAIIGAKCECSEGQGKCLSLLIIILVILGRPIFYLLLFRYKQRYGKLSVCLLKHATNKMKIFSSMGLQKVR